MFEHPLNIIYLICVVHNSFYENSQYFETFRSISYQLPITMIIALGDFTRSLSSLYRMINSILRHHRDFMLMDAQRYSTDSVQLCQRVRIFSSFPLK